MGSHHHFSDVKSPLNHRHWIVMSLYIVLWDECIRGDDDCVDVSSGLICSILTTGKHALTLLAWSRVILWIQLLKVQTEWMEPVYTLTLNGVTLKFVPTALLCWPALSGNIPKDGMLALWKYTKQQVLYSRSVSCNSYSNTANVYEEMSAASQPSSVTYFTSCLTDIYNSRESLQAVHVSSGQITACPSVRHKA